MKSQYYCRQVAKTRRPVDAHGAEMHYPGNVGLPLRFKGTLAQNRQDSVIIFEIGAKITTAVVARPGALPWRWRLG